MGKQNRGEIESESRSDSDSPDMTELGVEDLPAEWVERSEEIYQAALKRARDSDGQHDEPIVSRHEGIDA